jgi:hypothetical protein
MIAESITTRVHYITLLCDFKGKACRVGITSGGRTREECNQYLYDAGWRLRGVHQCCPKCLKVRRHKTPKAPML